MVFCCDLLSVGLHGSYPAFFWIFNYLAPSEFQWAEWKGWSTRAEGAHSRLLHECPSQKQDIQSRCLYEEDSS